MVFDSLVPFIFRGCRWKVRLWLPLPTLAVILFCGLFLGLVPVAGLGAGDGERPPLRVGYADFPPYEYQDENGRPAGLFIEMTQKVAREAGYEVEFILLPISRLYLYLKNGQIDLWPGLTAIPALRDSVIESWASPFPVQEEVWYLEETPPIHHLEQLNDHIVISIAGYTYGGLLSELENSDEIVVTRAPNHEAALDMLRWQRGHYLLDYREPVEEVLKTRPIEGLKSTRIRTRNAAWLFSLAKPHAYTLREAFDDAYIRLGERGEIPEIRSEKRSYALPGLPEYLH